MRRYIVIQDEAYCLEPQDDGDLEDPHWRTRGAEAVKDSRDRVGGPHRWAYAKYLDWITLPMLIGEYKNPSGRTVKRLRTLMHQGDIDDFFVRMAKDENFKPSGETEDKVDEVYSKDTRAGNKLVAWILCRNYHYMIATGVEYAYVATGDHIMFLRAPKDDWRTLYYHWCDFTVPSFRDVDVRKTLNKGIDAAEKDLKRWPLLYDDDDKDSYMTFPKEPPVDDDEFIGMGPDPCTQACLRGLLRQEALDDKCPNVDVHRAAAELRGAFRHPLTADELSGLVIKQLAVDPDLDCQCLCATGVFGRHGVLFKITLTGYGYTFVAKGVRASDRRVLEHEEKMYKAAYNVQGQIVPVCLGVVKLNRAIPLHSYVLYEKQRTSDELYVEGVENQEPRSPNMAWNNEVGRVMHFDLYRSTLVPDYIKKYNAERDPRLVQRPLRAPAVRQFLRSLHATAPNNVARQPPPGPDPSSLSSAPSSSPSSPHRPPARRRADPIPFELPPDIERNLLPDSERQEGFEEQDDDFLDQAGHINLGGHGGADGTITPLERQAFRRIFREISHRQQQEDLEMDMYGYEGNPELSGEYAGDGEAEGGDILPADVLPKFRVVGDNIHRDKVNAIVGEATDDQVLAREHQRNLRRQGEEEAAAAASQTQTPEADVSVLSSLGSAGSPPAADPKAAAKRNHILAQFPPSLRSAAGKAFGIKDEARAGRAMRQIKEETTGNPTEEAEEVEPSPPSPAVLARRKRQEKMELAMLSKKTDFALWQYMEENVFTLVDEFGIGKTPESAKKGSKVSAKLTANGPLYPALLLHGQRLLDSHFAGGATSPLALAVLPRIKSLGLASYVLGASTQLYNHLLGMRWLRQGDANAVFGLLSEMQRAGLAFDQSTLNLVKSIEYHVVPLTGGRPGLPIPSPTVATDNETAFLVAALKQLPELAAIASTAAYWRQVVERSVNWGRRL
ncbi:hypothetical protein Sste5344_009634 [Sporothrix stenoceras]